MNRIIQRIRALLQRFSHKGKPMNHPGRKRREWSATPGMELPANETVEQWQGLHEGIWQDGFIPLLRNSRRPVIKEETEHYIQLSPYLAIAEIISHGRQEDRNQYHALYGLAIRHMGAAFGPGLETIRLFKPEHATFRPVTYLRYTRSK